jgi:hypothetical protein
MYEQTGDLEQARTVYRTLMQLDPAYGYMTDAERDDYAARLPPP